jgi:hypothetical protein
MILEFVDRPPLLKGVTVSFSLDKHSEPIGGWALRPYDFDEPQTTKQQDLKISNRAGVRAFNIPAGMLRTVVVLFRPSALTRILHFDADRDGLVQGEERKKTAEAMKQSSTAIAPVLAAGDIKAWFNGESVPVVQVTHVPEYDGGGVWQSQYVVQLSLPAGVAVHPWNEVRIEVESTEELNGKKIVDWGQGSVGFSYAR